MSLIGKGSTSLRKQDVLEQKSVALGFKKIKFAHQASAGDTGINLGSLITPSDMSSLGFSQASTASLLNAQIYTYRNNLRLTSSLRGLLIDQLSYVVGSNQQITFVGFTAAEGEIFVGHLDSTPASSINVVDGNQIVASGILTAGQTDFNIGTPIEINKNPGTLMGSVMVFADRGLQYRKAGNVATGDGDYIEVPVAGGVGSLIRFNASSVDRYITVVSNGVVAERPDGSMMAAIERVQGQVDAIVPVLAETAGVPTTTFQTAPSNVDLKQFGDALLGVQALVAAYEARIAVLETPIRNSVELTNTGGYGSTDNKVVVFNTIQTQTGGGLSVSTSTTNGTRITVNTAGLYSIHWNESVSNSNAPYPAIVVWNNATAYPYGTTASYSIPNGPRKAYVGTNVSNVGNHVSWTGYLAVGDVIRFHNDGTVNPSVPAESSAIICQVGR